MSGDELSRFDEQMSRRHLFQKGALGAATLGVSGGLLGTLGAHRAAAATTSQQATLRQLDLAIALGLDTSPIWAGIDNGFYNQHGLEMKPHTFFSGVQLVNSLASGESQVSPIGTAVHYSAVSNGIPLKIIGIMHGSPVKQFYSTNYVVAGPNAGVGPGEVAKLKGKKIGTPLGTDGVSGLFACLAKVGLSGSDVRLINMGPPDFATALQTGAVDAISFVEPWPTLVLSRVPGAVRVTQPAPIFGPGILVSTDETIKSKRALLIDFLAATAQAQQWARRNLTRGLIEVNTRHTTIPAEVATKAINRIRFDSRISKLTLSRLAYKTIPTLLSIDVLKKGVDARTAIDATLSKVVQEKFPQYFSDLPPIPRQYRL